MRYRTLANRGFILPMRLHNAGSAYEGGSATGSRARNWQPSAAGPNSAATQNLTMIRRRARDAVRNDPWAKTAVTRWVSNVIATGIQPYPKHPDRAMRMLLKQLWADWTAQSDADGRLDFYGQQALAERAMFVDGEALAILRPRLPRDGLTVPLQIQSLEGDHLPVELTHPLANGNEIVNGVEFDKIGRRVAYHLLPHHPGEYGRMKSAFLPKRFDSARIVHAYQILRPGQVRGVSSLATVLLRLKTLDNFDDAVAFRQEVSNLFAGFIKKQDPTGDGIDPIHGGPGEFDEDGTPIVSLEPGSMNELAPGEDVAFASPPGAPNDYQEFTRQQLMAAFASVGIPYEIATGDLRNISDRTLRVVVNEFHRLIEQHQWGTFIHQWCRPIWNAWLEALVIAGHISAADFKSHKREWQRVTWVPEGWAYFNPVQDVKAKTDEIRAGLTSKSAVILAQGEDPETVLQEIIADNEAADAAGLVFDSDGRNGKRSSGTQLDDDPADPARQPLTT
ncbi:phage portal protein [Allopusillimonas soli]|uniref:Phage portal protein n=1 Tax=Allopusillimonas soli TaxID=659016 RepID=A0A853FGP3_9BURK|nr:phage portal protein [Allopusillimonas soli]NYT38878.1 phage portal protein [Allopusillimonas soli]